MEQREVLAEQLSTPAVKATAGLSGIFMPTVKKNKKNVWVTASQPLSLTFDQADFLLAYEKNGKDIEKASKAVGKDFEWAKRFLRKRAVQAREAMLEEFASVGNTLTPDYVKTKLARGIEKVEDFTESQKFSLKEAKDIVFPRQGAQINIQNNLLQMPPLSAEQESKIREFADKLADMDSEAANAR